MKLSNKKFRTLVAATIGAVSIGAVSSVSFAASEGVHVDQVGYLTDYSKVAMVSLPNCGDDFSVVDTATGKTVFTGKLTAPEFDASSAEKYALLLLLKKYYKYLIMSVYPICSMDQ